MVALAAARCARCVYRDASTPLKRALDGVAPGNGGLAKIANRLDASLDLLMPFPCEREAIEQADRSAIYADARVFLPFGGRACPWVQLAAADLFMGKGRAWVEVLVVTVTHGETESPRESHEEAV